MAITINGTGSITGVSVGGLPDGIVDTDMLAADAVTVPKIGYNGAVLQVVSSQAALSSDIASSSTTYVNSGLEVSITPVAAGSNILVQFFNFHPHTNAANGNYGVAYLIYRSVNGGTYTACTSGHTSGYYSNGSSSTAYWKDGAGNVQILDDPTYTLGNSITYRLYFRAPDNNTTNCYAHHNGGLANQTDTTYYNRTAMEISA
jgi:hypothetical protein